MRIQFLNGGLANQAFQYIFAKYYELSHPWDVMYLDDTYFTLYTVHNGYELEKVFGIRPHMLSECFSADVWEFILEERKKGKSTPQILLDNGIDIMMVTDEPKERRSFNPFSGLICEVESNEFVPHVFDMPGNIYYFDYWINFQWFADWRDEFLAEFSFPEIRDERNRSYADRILSTNSLSIHIRRGDFVTLGWEWDTETYRQNVTAFLEQAPGTWHPFIFSDDIAWCKAHEKEMGLDAFSEITYVEGNVREENFRDMQLMSLCRGMVLSNSSFSYLSALLNTRKKYVLNPTQRAVQSGTRPNSG